MLKIFLFTVSKAWSRYNLLVVLAYTFWFYFNTQRLKEIIREFTFFNSNNGFGIDRSVADGVSLW
jgi:hypothetical protein